jgi:CRP-like cAMP-binding protein
VVEAAAVNVLEGLSEAEIERLVGACEQTTHAGGEVIFSEGDEGDVLYLVRSGEVRIAKAISLDVDRTLAVLGEGGVFGELVIIGEGVRSATARAVGETTVLAMSRDSFTTLTEEAPALGMKVMGRMAAMLANRLRVTTDLLRDTVQWGLQLSGAAALDLHHIAATQTQLAVDLSHGVTLEGRLLAAEKTDAGLMLTFSGGDGDLHLVPYHAVVRIRLPKDVLGDSEEA